MPLMGYCSKRAVGAEDKVFSQEARPSGSPTFVSLFMFSVAAKSLLLLGIVSGVAEGMQTYCPSEGGSLVREWTHESFN